ncbi:MAG TPA: hypothetical protein VN812_22580, partial [Candidatus Acidoferrales bacterium]|nr:hypothetical protein [Candidatus Acidoferrales bacterium]
MRLAIEAAIEDHKIFADLAKHGGPTGLLPLSAAIHYHARALELLDNKQLTVETLHELAIEQNTVNNLFIELDR